MPKAARDSDSRPSSLEIRLLGPFRIAIDGVRVEEGQWSRRKPKLLVKLLALHPHHQLHREQLMELLWPNSEPEAAANNLYKAIHLARHALEPTLRSAASNFIVIQDQQVVLRAPGKLWADVCEFEQRSSAALKSVDVEAYEAALELYEGDLLTEDLYEDWAASRREQLRTLYQDLLMKLAQLYEAHGEYPRGIERCKELITCDATNEEAQRRLMRLYALTGNKHQALRQYQSCCAALQAELEAKPESATVELRRQIVSGELAPPTAATENAGNPTSARAISSLAILPFSNAGNDPAAEYLSDGITESIINSLSQLPQLKVMARSTVFRYKACANDPQEIGGELGVCAVLTGKVSHRGDTLSIQTELVDVTDGSQLWGERYRRSSSDIFELQEEIAREITRKLQLRLTGEEKGRLTKRHTENAEAYQLYLKGCYLWNKRTPEGVKRSIEYFQQAIDLDPHYALAYTGVSNSYAKLGHFGLTALPPREAFSKARTAALRALEIDDCLAEAHTSLAHVHMHNYEWKNAGREYRRAIELSPNYATVHHWYAYYLIMSVREDEAMAEIAKALELDPLSLPINTDLGDLLYFTRRYDEAVEQLQKTLEMDAYYYQAHLILARVYEQKGMFAESLTEFVRALELSGDSTDARASLGHAYAASGDKEAAREVLARLIELSHTEYVSPYDVALIHLALGDTREAFKCLRLAHGQQAAWGIYLNVDPRLDPLRSDKRFKALVRQTGLHDAQVL